MVSVTGLLTKLFLTDRIEAMEEEEAALKAAGKEPDCPFSSPFWWAGYILWGDPNIGGQHPDNVTKKQGGQNLSFSTKHCHIRVQSNVCMLTWIKDGNY